MVPGTADSWRFFRFRGIHVYVHWMWFLWAFYQITTRSRAYSWIGWNIAEYLALFFIVLLHEFGHAFACRQTGGKADKIVLWPLGGVAFVQPPPRAGAELWSIAAGPLVNVVLFPLLMVIASWSESSGLSARVPDFGKFIYMIWWINRGLLIFNLLPIYPLDGGQILRSLLWFKLGRARSLLVATLIGFVGLPIFALYVLSSSSGNLLMIGLMVWFLGQQCLAGFRQAQALLRLERVPRHSGYTCAACGEHPPRGAVDLCAVCGQRFDAFANDGTCPHCRNAALAVACVRCGTIHPITRWAIRPRGRAGEGPIIDV
ncbi:MAG: hypothetical protein RL077_3749 [Verrucomicrobiota bacterium]